MKRFLRVLLILLLVIAVAVGGLLGWLTATEYKPAAVESLDFLIHSDEAATIPNDAELKILSWNVGYAGLGKDSDFFMDGGKDARSADQATVQEYLAGISGVINGGEYDFVLLEEVDTDSSRTYGINEAKALAFGTASYAFNYSCPFVPVPVPPLGKVNSGLLSCSAYEVSDAQRVSLPCPFSWPLRIANLKRCLMVSYLPIEGSDKQLVLVNLHLEAYDDGEGKIAQTNQLREFIETQYQLGNYVIAGGDFNQTFPGSLDVYPMLKADFWTPGVLDDSLLPEGWRFAYDTATPSCRLLNQPYDPSDLENTQYYVIDGFILSPNVELNEVRTLDLAFENSDHNPVELSVTLK